MEIGENAERPAPTGLAALVERVAGALAIVGGAIMFFAASLVTASVIGRWLFNRPVPADYELVEICVAVSVFAFLSYTQARNGHIMVDTFTTWLPARVTAMIDALWTLVLAGFLGFFAWGLFTGGQDAMAANETLIQLPWPIWPVYMICAGLCALTCLVALAMAVLGVSSKR